MRLPLHTSDSGAWLYDADSKYLADFTHSKYTCEQIRQNAADVVAMSHELDRLRAANARQRAWIDGVMGQEPHSLAAVPYVFAACFVPPEHALTTKTVELITRPAPFEDK